MKKLVLLLIALIPLVGFSQGNALDFDGSNDGVFLPSNANLFLPPNTGATVEAWIKTTTTSGGTIWTNQNCGEGQQFIFKLESNGTMWTRIRSSASPFAPALEFAGSTPVNDGNWHHVATVHDPANNTASIYVDGVLDASQIDNETGQLTANTPFNRIGIRAQCGDFAPFQGTIDEVRLWKEARSQAQLNANKCIELTGNEQNLAGYWKFNSGTAGGNNAGVTTAIDEVGGSNGTLQTFALNGASSNWVASDFSTSAAACQPITPVPTISQWGLIILGISFLFGGAFFVRRMV